MIDIILNSKSKSEACKKLGYHTNGVGSKKIDKILEDNGYDKNYFKNKNKRYCLECGFEIVGKSKRSGNKFCNSSCSATYNNKKRKLDYNKTKDAKCFECDKDIKIKANSCDTNTLCNICREKYKEITNRKYGKKNKVINRLRNRGIIITDDNREEYKKFKKRKVVCIICKKEFEMIHNNKSRKRKTCSDECKSKLLSELMKERVKSGNHQGWQTRNIKSYPEKFFKKVLDNNNLLDVCEMEYKINKRKDLNIDEPYNYFLDFYFTDKNIDLEIDGKQHKERKEHDKIRDSRLEDIGIKVYRIKWKSINNKEGKEYIKNEINKFLDFYNNN